MTKMIELLDSAIDAHGGLWGVKGHAGILADVGYEAQAHAQRATLLRFGAPDRKVQFTPDRLELQEASGQFIEARDNPRSDFIGHRAETPWDLLHVGYFSCYALWTYLTQPFLYASPGFICEEIEPWHENGETWRRLKVVFSDSIASHTREQITYFGADGLMRRHDYTVEVLGGSNAAHYIDSYQDFDGFKYPTRRRVYRRADDGRPMPEPLLVGIDVRALRFS